MPLQRHMQARQSASRNLLPQLFQSTVIVVPCIANGLPQLDSDFLECVAFKEEQLQCLALAFCEFGEPALKGFTSIESRVHLILKTGIWRPISDLIHCVIQIQAGIKVTRGQVASPGYRPSMRHLENPETR